MKRSINNFIFFTLLLTVTHANGFPWGFTIFYQPTHTQLKENHLKNLKNRLWSFSQDDRDQIVGIIKEELSSFRYQELKNSDRIEEIFRSTVLNLLEDKVQRKIRNFAAQGQPLSRDDENFIKEDMRADIIRRLSNNDSLAPYSSENIANTLYTSLKNRAQCYTNYEPRTYPQYHNSYYQEPYPIQKEITHSYTYNAPQQPWFAGNLSDADTRRLKILNPQNPFTEENFKKLAVEKVRQNKQKLAQQVTSKAKLDDSSETTESNLTNAIAKALKTEQGQLTIPGLLSGKHIKEEILQNMGIQCPICFNYFRQEYHGQSPVVDQVILKAANQNKVCGHALCTTCVQAYRNECPLCREAVDQQDLNQKLDPINSLRPIYNSY